MIQKLSNWMLMAALAVGLGMGVTSCKDDDNNDNSSGQTAEDQAAKAETDALVFWNVMSQLADISVADGGSPASTFEPTIGTPAPNQPQTRVVATNSLEAAVASFNNLTGAAITEDTQEYTWQNDAVGTLTWHKTGTTSLATVDVSITQMPHLSQIMYMTPEQMGLNADWECCYYRFGDVISRKRPEDGELEYWVCVRPSFDPEGKGDSHWITVSPLPESNIESYDKASNGIKYAMPTKIGLNKEHMQNLAEMLYAMNFPDDWSQNITNYSTENFFGSPGGLPIFHDFHSSKIKYNNSYFFKNVNKAWMQKKIYEKVFGYPQSYFSGNLNTEGLHLLAEGYSWLWTFSNYLTLYEYTYTNGTKKESNMHKMTYTKQSKDVIVKGGVGIEINVRKMTLERPYLKNYEFFGNDAPRFIVRHATGEELGIGGGYDKQQALAGTGTDADDKPIKEVYRYYRDVYPQWNLLEEPEITSIENPMTEFKFKERGFYNTFDVVTDNAGDKWFCVQPSSWGSPNPQLQDEDLYYAYFISLDETAVGSQMENVTKKRDVAAQILADLQSFYNNLVASAAGTVTHLHSQHLQNATGIDIDELFALRDSLATLGGEKHHVNSQFISTFYKDENNKLHILRLIGDLTATQADGARAMAWRFYNKYTKGLNKNMLLDDLDSQETINSYNADVWVNQPWYDRKKSQTFTKNTGPRTTKEKIAPLARFLYEPGRNAIDGTVPANMYREPIIPFAVKRVKDKGECSSEFEDGTPYEHYSLTLSTIPSLYSTDGPVSTVSLVYSVHQQSSLNLNTVTLNNERYELKLNNRP